MPAYASVMFDAETLGRVVDPIDVIRSFDIEADVPLRQALATGLLRMAAAVQPQPEGRNLVVDVGTAWCEIVHADVEYRLDDGVRLAAKSRSAAAELKDLLARGGGPVAELRTDVAYVLARWNDAVGKIRYRTTAFTRAVKAFAAAEQIALENDIWWIIPDLRSNLLRAQFEELRQGISPTDQKYAALLRNLIEGLEKAEADARRIARADLLIKVEEPAVAVPELTRAGNPTGLEFVRGFSSVLHNLSVAVHDKVVRHDRSEERSSLTLSRQASAWSEELGDDYRLFQALLQQAAVARDLDGRSASTTAVDLYDRVIRGRWQRGRLIARQQRALLMDDKAERASELERMLSTDLASTSEDGSDLDVRAYTTRLFAESAREVAKVAGGLPAIDGSPRSSEQLEREIERYELDSVRAVRQVVAAPLYKRGYSSQVRPIYQAAVTSDLAAAAGESDETDGRRHLDRAFALVEESSARELLDLLSARNLPQSADTPEPVGDEVVRALHTRSGRRGDGVRRDAARRVPPAAEEALLAALSRRADEFDAVLQEHPVEIAEHDPEVAHRVMMLMANEPRTALVRYFVGHDPEGFVDEEFPKDKSRDRIWAFLVYGRDIRVVRGPLKSAVARFASSLALNRAPTAFEAGQMWSWFLDDVWKHLDGTDVDNLVIVPTDELFALPLHVARPTKPGARPLGAEIATAFSVSATAYISRSRHLLRRLAVDDRDDLAVVMGTTPEDRLSGGEIVASGWDGAHVKVLGMTPPAGLPKGATSLDLSWESIREVEADKPEFFAFVGHGGYSSEHSEFGPYLVLPTDVMTQFDMALRLRLPRNKLTVLGACVAAQGMASRGGEVAGFVRSLMAAGAGAIALPLWSALDSALVETVGGLLASAKAARHPAGQFLVVEALRDIHRRQWDAAEGGPAGFEAMPLALYL